MSTFAKFILNAAGHIIGRGVARLGLTERRRARSPAAAPAGSCATSPPGMLVVIHGGSEGRPEDAFAVSRGHDAEIVGDQPGVLLDLGVLGDGEKRR